MPADSAKISDVERLVKEVSKTTDHVDILFANAGATWGEKFDTHPDGAFAKVMDLNVKSVFNTIRLYVPGVFDLVDCDWSTGLMVQKVRSPSSKERYCRRSFQSHSHRIDRRTRCR